MSAGPGDGGNGSYQLSAFSYELDYGPLKGGLLAGGRPARAVYSSGLGGFTGAHTGA